MLASVALVAPLLAGAGCTAAPAGGDGEIAALVGSLQGIAGPSDVDDALRRAEQTDAAMLAGLVRQATGDEAADDVVLTERFAAVTVDPSAFVPPADAPAPPADAPAPPADAPAQPSADRPAPPTGPVQAAPAMASSSTRPVAATASVVRAASPAVDDGLALFAARTAGTMLMSQVFAATLGGTGEIEEGMTKHVVDGPLAVDLGFSDGRFGGSISLRSPTTDPAMPGMLTSGIEFDLQGCPAVDGTFSAEVRGTGRLDIEDGGSTTWASEQWSMAVSGQVDDSATVTDATLTHRLESTAGSSTADGRSGADFASEWVLSSRNTPDGRALSAGSLPRIDRSSGAITTAETVRRLRYQFDAATLQSWLVLHLIQQIVSSGTCVQLAVEGPASLPRVEPGSTTTVAARPTRRVDGADAGGVVAAEVRSGKGAIEPTTKTPAPATFFSAAPFENDYTTVDFTSTSRSGVGHASQTFAVGGGWVARRFAAGVLLEGRKCGPVTGEWQFTAIADWGYHADIAATVGADLTGSYTITGSTEVSTFSGGGTVSLEASGEEYLMHFDSGDAPVQVIRDPSMHECLYEVD